MSKLPLGDWFLQFVRCARSFVAAVSLLGLPAAAQVVLPGDVIAVSETVSADTLRIHDGCTGALKTTFTDERWRTTSNGRYVSIGPNGTIWVGDRVVNELFGYDSNLQPLQPLPGAGCLIPSGNGKGFAFDGSGRVLITTTGGDQVVTFFPCGGGAFTGGGNLPETWGLDIIPSGALTGHAVVSLHTVSGLLVVDPQTGTQVRPPIDCSMGSTPLGRCWQVDALQSGLVIVNDWQNQLIRAVDPTRPPGSECIWAFAINAPVYPHAPGMSVNETQGLIHLAVFRNGGYWLERYDLSTRSLVCAPTPMQPSGYSFLPPSNIVVVPGGTCASMCIMPFCLGDGTGAPCPCGNTGNPGQGCSASNLLGGGRLTGTGSTSVSTDTVLLTASSIQQGATGLFFQGTAQVNSGLGGNFGDGLRCAGGNVIRLATRTAGPGNSMSLGHPTDTAISILGTIAPAGETRHYQVWYRNNADFCVLERFNLTNGLTIQWGP